MKKIVRKRRNGKAKRQTPEKSKTRKGTKKGKRGIQSKKVFFYALGIAVAGGAGFIVYDKIVKGKQKANQTEVDNSDAIVINNNLPTSTNSSGSFFNKLISHNSEFPLKRGSRGSKVTMLQQSLARIIGTSAMNANGGIDGQFGPGTANALKSAGYSEIVDEDIFNKITGSDRLTIIFNPQDLAKRLYRASDAKDIDTVLSILKQLKSTSDYSAVNDYYKRQGFVSKTIVTDLLDIAFNEDETSKEEIKTELSRVGLKVDDAGRWTLSGLRFKDLITLRATVVTDSKSNKIPVKRNTILGNELSVANGMTWFRSIDNEVLRVPTQDVKYS
jgi:hypothetical protein